jgi:hypothetical protein
MCSTFVWYVCYHVLQRGIGFDALYGWEQTLLEPSAFWKRVPSSVLPYYHFFNTPIRSSAGGGEGHRMGRNSGRAGLEQSSAMQIIQHVARVEDFVSFKLDIDTPSVELPIILQLLQSEHRSVTMLIDELFFELHFRCEFLMHCGWGESIPRQQEGLLLDRFHVLQVFQQLREMGIRAHFWP